MKIEKYSTQYSREKFRTTTRSADNIWDKMTYVIRKVTKEILRESGVFVPQDKKILVVE